jgi:hypothetical protein
MVKTYCMSTGNMRYSSDGIRKEEDERGCNAPLKTTII